MKFRLPPHIPVRVTLGFWITAAILGFLLSMNLVGMLVWVGIIFISVLIHEYGHAITSYIFGQHPHIELVPFGGLTYPEGKKIAKWKEFIVVFNGPLFGFGIFVVTYLMLKSPAIAQSKGAGILTVIRNVNLFWTVVNLLPVLPLDGGHLLRIICQSIFKARGLKIALMTSLLISVGFCLTFFLVGYFLIGAIFILFAFQNFEMYRHSKHMTAIDEDERIQEKLKSVELAFSENRQDDAEPLLKELVDETKKGMIHLAAVQYLAKIHYDHREYDKVYSLLKRVRKELAPEQLIMLHHVASEVGDHRLTLDLAGASFQYSQDPVVAFRSARAAAWMSKEKPALGWLKAAKRAGLENFDEAIKEECFNPLRPKL